MFPDDLSILLRVLVACLLAGILGWERESAGKEAGLRTHILVGVAAVIFVTIADSIVVKYQVYPDTVRFDPVRVIEAIVTGISFLGAGMIIFRRGEGTLQGLTTAAGILTTAAIGTLVGLERYFLAVGCTAIVFFVLRVVSYFEVLVSSDKPKKDVQKSESEEAND